MSNTDIKWWQKEVFYQIYPRSFCDADGDGMGDIKGIISKLDYLHRLGVGGIWLSPVCKSPQADNGYDVSDYQDIDPMFGTLEDMDVLIAEAKKRGMRIIMDMVLNHSSDEHRWFIEAKKSKDNPYHDYYVWRDGTPDEYPNDMMACFGGHAWDYVPELGQYYFHQFHAKQPDLNWENDKLREEIFAMIRWWIDRGVGGFRFDVIDNIAKEPDKKVTSNGTRLHEFIKELSAKALQYGAEIVSVGEAWSANIDNAPLWSNPDGSELSMVFQFEHSLLDQVPGMDKWALAPLKLADLKAVLGKWQTELYGKGWNSLFWDNHDLPRIVSRWGNDGKYRVESAKMLAALLHGMQGTPYIYQGEELGMTNAYYTDISQYQDVEILNMYEEKKAQGVPVEEIMRSLAAKGRDNARTPMQWDATKNAGFSTGTPWLQVISNYKEINAAAQVGDMDSVFNFYRKLITMRKENPVFVDGRFTMLYPESENLFAYVRENDFCKMTVICNFYEKEVTLEAADLAETAVGIKVLGNYRNESATLKAYETRIYMLKK